MSVVGLLIFWRVVMGVGISGDYPLSSIITSEYAQSSTVILLLLTKSGLPQQSGAAL
jgi:MFS family permease